MDDCKKIWPCQFCGEGTTAAFVADAVASVTKWGLAWLCGDRSRSLNDCLVELASRWPDH